MKPQEIYKRHSYDTKERFCSYWHQIAEVLSLNATQVLEIGVGNAFASNYLKDKGLDVTTLDIEHTLNPLVVASVLAIPFPKDSFEVVTCYEVLEHLPYKDFNPALKELARVSQRYVIISLPDVTTTYRINIELPRIKPIKKLVSHPFPRPANHTFDGYHYWEIGKKQYPFAKIQKDIKLSSLKILKSYRVFEFYYHRFFLLEKTQQHIS
jgi:ubiquinone/menaquinone biosynthesis C-methylase UbiE